jgi:hypothetical protein
MRVPPGSFSFTRGVLSYCDMSDRMTTSPGCRPCSTSTLLAEPRPRRTLVRTALPPPGRTLNIPSVLSACP